MYGALVADRDTLPSAIGRLRAGQYGIPIVLVNRYNGIDLPDDQCRILVLDSRPYADNLIDRYEEACRSESVVTLMRAVRSVEQGMGRSVRGEKDFSVIVVTGADLTRLVRDRRSREFLSSQMAAQIEIGIEIAEMAQEEIERGVAPMTALYGLIQQCLKRDEGWKAFYIDQMSGVVPKGPNREVLQAYATETLAEEAFIDGNIASALNLIQGLLDSSIFDQHERGWYLQTMARYEMVRDRVAAQALQVSAYKNNKLLLKPTSGVAFVRIEAVGEGRVDRIANWMSEQENYAQLDLALTDALSKLAFGVKADRFEEGLNQLAVMLGFVGERPDKEWKEGPDNLWALDQKNYVIWECKNEVNADRSEINKRESDQMNQSSAWFIRHYPGLNSKKILVHPAAKLSSAASLLHEVEVMRPKHLKRLLGNVRGFFASFKSADFNDLSRELIKKQLDANELTVSHINKDYSEKIKSTS